MGRRRQPVPQPNSKEQNPRGRRGDPEPAIWIAARDPPRRSPRPRPCEISYRARPGVEALSLDEAKSEASATGPGLAAKRAPDNSVVFSGKGRAFRLNRPLGVFLRLLSALPSTLAAGNARHLSEHRALGWLIVPIPTKGPSADP